MPAGPEYHRFGQEIARRRRENALMTPAPEAVFAIEEALGLDKGTLHYLLGYLKAEPSEHNHTAMLDPTWRPGWNQYFLGIAQAVARRADCRRAKFGAVIVDSTRRIVSTGYNGAPPGEGSCLAGDCPRGLLTRDEQPSHADGGHGAQDFSNCISLHAEMNAVAYAGRVPGGTIYIASIDRDVVVACDMCSKLIKAAGIEQVVCQ